jgi:glycosyltransferase involved in cell wall biosynthesis
MSSPGPVRVVVLLEANYVTGAAKAVLEFAREAAANRPDAPRFAITVVIFRRGPEHSNANLTATMRALGIRYETIFERRAFDLAILPQLANIAEKLQPDLIWSNSIKSHFLVRWTGLARKTAWVAYHHGYTTSSSKLVIYNQLDRWSLPAADRVLTVCKPFASQLVARGVRPERICVQGMPIRPFEPVPKESIDKLRDQLGIRDGTTVLLSVGRLSREKGHADLLLAFRRLCDGSQSALRLLVVGDGPEREKLDKLTRDLLLSEKVSLVGQQADVRPFYAVADVFVLPSHSEGTPNVLLEAMAVGVPAVATSVGGVPELTCGGEAALLTEKEDVEGLANALTRLMKEPDLRARLISAGREVVEKNTTERYFRALAAVFRGALGRAV